LSPALLFDLLLCGLILGVALCAVAVRDLFAAIVFFIIYGVLAAIAWVRLDAPDVALAEAAIGAGLTGILLLGAAARFRHTPLPAEPGSPARRRLVTMAQVGLCGMAAAALAATVATTATPHSGIGGLVEQDLANSGVTNPVTAVLLNFRGYDTLLETMVLLVALVAIWSLTDDRFWGGVPGLRQHARPDGVLAFFGRVLPMIGFLVGVHLLWAGSHAPGGAFQAGTVLAAVWLLVAMAGLARVPPVSSIGLRLLLVAGPFVFLAFGAAGALGGTLLRFAPASATGWILAIETLLTLSIAATLCMLVLGPPRRRT
jgi:multisubunit Na+/H+ antiporter MnhB subunit